MKKFIAGLGALVMCMSCVTGSGAEGLSTVTISCGSDREPLSFTYSDESMVTEACDITRLMPSIDEVTENKSVTSKITINSVRDALQPVRFSLRLSKPQKAVTLQNPARVTPLPSVEDDNVLDFYNIEIEDSDGNKLYEYKKADKTDGIAQYRDIELKTLNTVLENESAVYSITLSVNKSMKDMENEASKLEWSLMADHHSLAQQTAVPTEKTAEPSAKPQTFGVFSKGTYTVGNEITAGRYEVKGNSTVKVYTENNELKANVILTKDENSQNGVLSYVLTLSDGERVDLTGDTEFSEYTPSRVTLAPVAASKPSASPAASTAASKKNPKTGDTLPLILVISMFFAATIAVLGLELYKKKHN